MANKLPKPDINFHLINENSHVSLRLTKVYFLFFFKKFQLLLSGTFLLVTIISTIIILLVLIEREQKLTNLKNNIITQKVAYLERSVFELTEELNATSRMLNTSVSTIEDIQASVEGIFERTEEKIYAMKPDSKESIKNEKIIPTLLEAITGIHSESVAILESSGYDYELPLSRTSAVIANRKSVALVFERNKVNKGEVEKLEMRMEELEDLEFSHKKIISNNKSSLINYTEEFKLYDVTAYYNYAKAFSSNSLLAILIILSGGLGAVFSHLKTKNGNPVRTFALGLGTGFIMYLSIQSELLTKSGVISGTLNPFACTLMAVTVGMFSDLFFNLIQATFSDISKKAQDKIKGIGD